MTTGEAVFTTTMTGYQEVTTDPSYYGQIVVMTAPMQAGELQILTIVKNGATIAKGDVAVEFDGAVVQRTILETGRITCVC